MIHLLAKCCASYLAKQLWLASARQRARFEFKYRQQNCMQPHKSSRSQQNGAAVAKALPYLVWLIAAAGAAADRMQLSPTRASCLRSQVESPGCTRRMQGEAVRCSEAQPGCRH